MKLLSKRQIIIGFFALGFVFVTSVASASTTGGAFKGFYDFIYDAATGYLGRGIAIGAGVVGLGFGAFAGKILIAGLGIGIAMFGSFGPQVVNALFRSAIV